MMHEFPDNAVFLFAIIVVFRVTHTIILEDPFPDPKGLIVPDRSPELTKEQLEVFMSC